MQVQEVCRLETMEGRCRWNSEVMVMTSARWGRMKTGRCLRESSLLAQHQDDPLFLGCYEDVLPVLDKKCSGHSQCDVRIPNDLDHIKPCYPELARYLEVSYACVKGKTNINNEKRLLQSLTTRNWDNVICSDGRFAKNENDLIRFDSVQPTSRCFINSLIFVKPVNDNVHVSISPVCL